MKKSQTKNPENKNEIIVELELSDDFICMCEFLNITHKQALDSYLQHIKFYNYLIKEDTGSNSEATAIFKKFKDIQFKRDGLKVAERNELHLEPIKKILSLGMSEEGSTSAKYENVIEKWHNNIFKAI